MGGRIISRKGEIGTLAVVLTAGLVPALVFAIGIAATIQPDLSDLSPIPIADGSADLLDWSSLLREGTGHRPAPRTGVESRVLGYMMDGEHISSEGEWVREFYLLPDAGHVFHPAHRDADQMIAVHLADDVRIRFSSRTLVWAWGSLQSQPGDAEGSKPLYSLQQAHAQFADTRDIRKFFQ